MNVIRHARLLKSKGIALLSDRERLRSRIARDVVGIGAFKLMSVVFGLLTTMMLARSLGPVEYGKLALVLAWIPILGLPIAAGMTNLIVREVAGYHQSGDWGRLHGFLRRAFQWVLASSFAVGTLVFVAALFVFDDSPTGVWALLPVAVVMLPLQGLSSLRASTLRGLHRTVQGLAPELVIVPGAYLLILAVLSLLSHLSARTAVIAMVIASAIAYGFGTWMLRRVRRTELPPAVPNFETRRWAGALVPFVLLATVTTLTGQLGIVLTGLLASESDVAALRVAVSGAQLVTFSLMMVNQVSAPYYARLRKTEDLHQMKSLAQRATRASFWAALPLATILAFFARDVIGTLFGAEYAVLGADALVVLVLGQLVNVAFGPIALILAMNGHERESLKAQAGGLFVNLVVAVLLIPRLGALGGAIGVVAGLLFWNVILAVKVRRRFGFWVSAFSR